MKPIIYKTEELLKLKPIENEFKISSQREVIMTAKNYLKSIYSFEDKAIHNIANLTYGDIIDLMLDFARLKCKEQRDICADMKQVLISDIISFSFGITDRNRIRNINEPEF